MNRESAIFEEFLQYDAETIKELVDRTYNKAIEDAIKVTSRYDYRELAVEDVAKITNGVIAELKKLKKGVNND